MESPSASNVGTMIQRLLAHQRLADRPQIEIAGNRSGSAEPDGGA